MITINQLKVLLAEIIQAKCIQSLQWLKSLKCNKIRYCTNKSLRTCSQEIHSKVDTILTLLWNLLSSQIEKPQFLHHSMPLNSKQYWSKDSEIRLKKEVVADLSVSGANLKSWMTMVQAASILMNSKRGSTTSRLKLMKKTSMDYSRLSISIAVVR